MIRHRLRFLIFALGCGTMLSLILPALAPGKSSLAPPEVIMIEESEVWEDLKDETWIDELQMQNADIVEVLHVISQKTDANIIAGKSVSGKVTVYLKEVRLRDALRIILDSSELAYRVEKGVVRVISAEEFEKKYGFKFGQEFTTRVVRIKHRDLDDMVRALNQMKSPVGKISLDRKSSMMILNDFPDYLNRMEMLIQETDLPLVTDVFVLEYAQAKDLVEKISDLLTKDVGRLKYDERTNKIIVTDLQPKIEEIHKIITAFDVDVREIDKVEVQAQGHFVK